MSPMQLQLANLDVLCGDQAVVDAVVDQLVLSVGAVTRHLDLKIDLVVKHSVFTHCSRELVGRDGAEV